jgi:MYXO-CTERM domain-containing protein
MKKLSLFVMALLGVAFTSTVAMAQEDLCTPFFECLDACGEDQACYQECAQEADPNVVNTYIAVSECGQAAGCFEQPEDQIEQCIVENCATEYDDFSNSCFGGGGGPANNGGIPSGPCDGAFECLNSCEDAQCALDCANQAETPDGQAAVSDYVNCVINNQCADETCVEENCGAEAGAIEAACFGGGGENNSSANNSEPFNNAGNNSEPFNNSGNNSEGNNGGVISPGNNGGSGNNSNPVDDDNDDDGGSSGNNSGGDNGGDGDEETDEEGDGSTTTVTCSVSSLGGATTSGGAFLLLGLVVLGLRRRR